MSSRSKGIERRSAVMTTSSHKEITEGKAKEKDACDSSKGGGRRGLRHIARDLPVCLNLKKAAASSSTELRQMKETTTSCREEDVKSTLQQQKEQNKKCSTGGGGRRLRHVEGDVPTYMKITERKKEDKEKGEGRIDEKHRSLSSSERIDEMFSEVQGCMWDAILVSETWRPKPEEVWKSDQGHIVMGAGKYENKHGAAIIVNKKWKHRIKLDKAHQRAHHCNIYYRQQAADHSSQRLHATQWSC